MFGTKLTLRIVYGTVDSAPTRLKPYVMDKRAFVQDLDRLAGRTNDPKVRPSPRSSIWVR
jgi:hypothetical protein